MLVCGPTLHENSLSPLQILVTGELVSSKLTQISFLIVTQSVWAEYNLKSKSIITNNDHSRPEVGGRVKFRVRTWDQGESSLFTKTKTMWN